MRVLQVTKLYTPWSGGVEKVAQDIAEGLNGRVTMSVLTCQPRGRGNREFVNGVRVDRAGSLGICLSMPISLSFPYLLKKLAKNQDVLHFHTPFPLGIISYLLIRPKGRLVVWWHSDIVRQKNILRLYRPFLLRFLERADKIIVATSQHIESSNFLSPFKNKCQIIPFGIDTKKFQITDEIECQIGRIRREHGNRIILFVGRLVYYKGVEYLIRAMKKIHGKLLLIGQGPLESKLISVIAELRLEDKVVFLGKLGNQEMLSYYHSCDVFVLPSIAKSEAFGIVQLEAMACGKAVVNTSLATGVPQVSIDGKTGITVPPKDADSLAKAINTLLTNKKLKEEYGHNALMRVKNHFTMEKMTEMVFQIYKHVLEYPGKVGSRR